MNRKHYYIISEQNNWKFDYLIDLIDSLVKRFVIFTNSKTNAIKIYKKLKKNNINVDKIVLIFLFFFYKLIYFSNNCVFNVLFVLLID